MKTATAVIMLGLFVVGCHRGINRYDRNRENLNKLEVGMSKNEVITIMGNPYQREVYGKQEFCLYQTKRIRSIYMSSSEYLTPVVFEDGKVVGWGRNYWVEKEKKIDLKIDQTVKQQ